MMIRRVDGYARPILPATGASGLPRAPGRPLIIHEQETRTVVSANRVGNEGV